MKLSKAQLRALEAVETSDGIKIKMIDAYFLMNYRTRHFLLMHELIEWVDLGTGICGAALTPAGRKALEECRETEK